MRWKLIILGGIAFYAAMFLISLATGPLIHEGLLKATYQAHAQLWRPELNQTPPDMAALMPRWITTGLLVAFLQVGIYGLLESAFSGAGWLKGLKYGGVLAVLGICCSLGYSGVFNAPDKIWAIWGLESLLYLLPAGALLGWLTERFHW